MLIVLLGYAFFQLLSTTENRNILNSLIDQPQLTTDDKFDVVYEVDTQVVILREDIIVRLANGERDTISAATVDSRADGTLVCDKELDPDCLDEFGELVMYRQALTGDSASDATEIDGTVELEGLLRPIGGIVELPNGDLIFATEDNLLDQREGTLDCDRDAVPDCEDLTGTIATVAVPYILETGLVLRDDVLIQFEDGFTDTVRPNRLNSLEATACDADTVGCQAGTLTTATFRERIVGTEIGGGDGVIRVRTVDEETEFIAQERIQNLERGEVSCDRDANPRCDDFEGTIVERAGIIISGELTLETNRDVNIIPDGEVTAVEINKSDIASETRDPAGCRVEDDGACMITVQEEDSVIAGRIIEDTDEGITIQTVAPVIVDIPEDSASLRRAPLTCSLNNIRGCNAGIWLTMLVTLTSYTLALIIGLLVGLMRVSSNPILYHLSTLYVEVIRGLPLLVLLLFFAFVIGPLLRDSSLPLVGFLYEQINVIEVAILGEDSFLGEAVLGLAIGYGAFLAEVFRAGIQSIGRGQMEAARSLGMSYPLAMRKVILPQAVRVILPPLGNDFIAMLKDSALISVLALPDLLQVGRLYITRTFQPIPVFVAVALVYILLTLVLSFGVRTLEDRMKLPGSGL